MILKGLEEKEKREGKEKRGGQAEKRCRQRVTKKKKERRPLLPASDDDFISCEPVAVQSKP